MTIGVTVEVLGLVVPRGVPLPLFYIQGGEVTRKVTELIAI
jgi:hypothetical protein